MTTRQHRWRRRDAGASAVEMAIVLPVLVLLAFGIIDFGRMLNAQIQLSQAAREGVRLAALAGGSGILPPSSAVRTEPGCPESRRSAVTGASVSTRSGDVHHTLRDLRTPRP